MNSLTKKMLKNSRSLTYTYYVSPAKSPLPTVLLIHGCPDSASLWADLITTHLQPGGYGVVAVDDLGYAGSSKPLSDLRRRRNQGHPLLNDGLRRGPAPFRFYPPR